MRRTCLALALSLGLGLSVGATAQAAPGAAPTSALAGTYASHAYPATRPNAGQYCKRVHRGVRTRAGNGRMVRCTPSGSRSRWRYR